MAWGILAEKRDDDRIRSLELRRAAKTERGFVEHAADLLRGVRNALAGGGDHRALDLFVAEAGEHGDDDEDERRDEEGQLAAKRLLREEGRQGRDCGAARSRRFYNT